MALDLDDLASRALASVATREGTPVDEALCALGAAFVALARTAGFTDDDVVELVTAMLGVPDAARGN